MNLDGNTQYVELDFYRNSYKSVKAKQYDKDTRSILVTCVNDASIYPLDAASMECNLKMITPDGRAMLKPQAIQPDGTILIKLEETMLLASGICKAELNILEQRTKKLLSTMNFDLIVIGSVYSNDIITASDEFDALTDALLKIDDARDLSERIQEAEDVRIENETGRISQENIRTTAERVRTAGEAERNAKESERAKNETARQEHEALRDTCEKSRTDAETERISSETKRLVNEADRIREEEERKKNEALRTLSEESRELSEADRTDSETIRNSAENNRTIEENKRSANESERIDAENVRKSDFQTMKSSMETATSRAEKIAVATSSTANSYQIELTDQDGITDTSPNLLNRISIGTVETGDAEESPAAAITGDFGNQKLNLRLPAGKPFRINRTFPSISAMESEKDKLALYTFVMINTGNVEDTDTGKLYMKDTSGMIFITDLSGTQGIQGVKGETGATPKFTIGSVTTGAEGTKAAVSITGTKENPILNLIIPKGDTGKVESVHAGSLPYASATDTNTIKAVVDAKLGKSENAASSTKAVQDKNGNPIDETYIKGLTVSGKVITYTKGNGTTGTLTTQDTNTTYGIGTSSAPGLSKLYTGTGSAIDGTMTQKAISGSLDTLTTSLATHNHNTLTTLPTNYKNALDLPTDYAVGVTVFMSSNLGVEYQFGNPKLRYCTVQTIKGIANQSCIQLIYPYNDSSHTNDNNIYYRYAYYNNNTWKEWKTISTSDHTHDGRYYTETEIDSKVGTINANIANHKASADHDGRYYTESEINNLLGGKAALSHLHDDRYLRLSGGSMTGSIWGSDGGTFAPNGDVKMAWCNAWLSTYIGRVDANTDSIKRLDSNKLSTSGGTITGELRTTNGIITGSSVSTYNHRFVMGTDGRDYCSFYEYGGVWNFIKHQNGTDYFNYYLNQWGWNVPGVFWNGTLNLKGSSFLNLCSPGIQCRNYNDTGWAGISASGFHTQSSKRYKENIVTMTTERAKKILDIEVVTFDYKDGVVDAGRCNRAGVIVEDAVDIIPEAISYREIDGENVPDGADYTKYVPYLIKMVQSQQQEIRELKNKLMV